MGNETIHEYDTNQDVSIDICNECGNIFEGNSKRINDEVYCYYEDDHTQSYGCFHRVYDEYMEQEK